MSFSLEPSTLPSDVLAKVFSYLDEIEVNACRVVHKQFQKTIDENDIYPDYVLRAKKAYHNILKIRDNDDQMRTLKIEIKTKMETLHKRRKTFSGYCVSTCFSNSSLNVIPQLFFPLIFQEEFDKQSRLDFALSCLTSHVKQREVEIDKEYSTGEIAYYRQRRKFVIARQKITDIFGGNDAFEKLPIFTLTELKSSFDNLAIHPSEMTAPIMRGWDKSGREFVILRARNEQENRLCCQILFKKNVHEGEWALGGYWIMPARPLSDFDNRMEIKQFVKTKIYKDWKLM